MQQLQSAQPNPTHLDLSVVQVLQNSSGLERRASQRSVISRDAHHGRALPHQLHQGPSGRPQQKAALTLHCDGHRAGLIGQNSLFPKVREATSLLNGCDRLAIASALELAHLDDVHFADGLAFLDDLMALVEFLTSKTVEGFLYSVLRQTLERLGELHA